MLAYSKKRSHPALGSRVLSPRSACARHHRLRTDGQFGYCLPPSNQVRQALHKLRDAVTVLRVVFGIERELADPSYPLPLRPRHERPRSRRAAEQRDELATPDHSITSSARASSVGGTSRPSAFAVLRLMASSYLVGACTGRSAGFSPLRMRST